VTSELKIIDTPCLLLSEDVVIKNAARMKSRVGELGVTLRPHCKTAKSVELTRRFLSAPEDPITVSTLKEAEAFAAAGYKDILYAVGIAPQKLKRVLEIRASGVDLSVILDSAEQAIAVAAASKSGRDRIPAIIEIDVDGHRSGVRADDVENLVEIGRLLHENGAELRGVMTLAGSSYDAPGHENMARCADQERAAATRAASVLREAGLPCPVVSVGSTPTALSSESMAGVTEVRAGVFVFFDLFQAGLGICSVDDIAISVLATVIGRSADKGGYVIDAGWTALSPDRSTQSQALDQGYGVVTDIDGRIFEDVIVGRVNQEHGLVSLRPGSGARMPELKLGDRVRILPNHACATAQQHGHYTVLLSDGGIEIWNRISGW
jgi:D-serine deaminase-like pyridoxal phosphate-dependent protein